ncbi:2-thiouracil desulfurase family protein, partial [Salmonella enterica subsp. enterica]
MRYDGGASGPFDQLAVWQAEGRVVAICPEVSGGLPTPRPSAEIPGGQGIDVWEGRAQVLTAEGEDFSAAFLDGARQALALAQRHNI